MSPTFPPAETIEIVISESLSQSARHVLTLSKAYQTIVLLYEDDLSDNVLAAWAEMDRLNLNVRKIGQVLNGIEVYTFGMDKFSSGTTVELCLREASQDTSRQDSRRSAYKSLLNELILIQVKIHPNSCDSIRLQ
jgi:hypothetical protein